MTQRRALRFGTGSYTARSRAEYVELTRKVEDLGYAVLLTPDHINDQLAPLTALMAAAAVTQNLRLGTYVCAAGFRHPVILAKEAATLDLLSDGRFEFGLGTGYLPFDYESAGLPLEAPGVRVSRLGEVIQIVKGLFGEGPLTFSGRYYTVRGLEGTPKPVQRPYPPLFIGGSGQRVLSLAAREADIVGLLPPAAGEWLDFAEISSAATTRRVDWIREAAGERFDTLELNTLVFAVAVTDQWQSAAEQLAAQWGTTPEQMLDTIHFLVGTVDQMVEDIRRWRAQFGISYVTVFPEDMEALAPVVARLAGT